MQPPRGRQDVWLLSNLAQSAEVANQVSADSSAYRNLETYPRSLRQRSKQQSQRSIDFLKQAEEPVGRQPLQQPSIVGERLGPGERRLQKVDKQEQAETSQLQNGRNAQEDLSRQQLRQSLQCQYATEDKRAGGD
jgi:hypothetical protein